MYSSFKHLCLLYVLEESGNEVVSVCLQVVLRCWFLQNSVGLFVLHQLATWTIPHMYCTSCTGTHCTWSLYDSCEHTLTHRPRPNHVSTRLLFIIHVGDVDEHRNCLNTVNNTRPTACRVYRTDHTRLDRVISNQSASQNEDSCSDRDKREFFLFRASG